jgi:hypothetical protein
LGSFYGQLVILCLFGIFFPVLVYCTMENLATRLHKVTVAFRFGEEGASNFEPHFSRCT